MANKESITITLPDDQVFNFKDIKAIEKVEPLGSDRLLCTRRDGESFEIYLPGSQGQSFVVNDTKFSFCELEYRGDMIEEHDDNLATNSVTFIPQENKFKTDYIMVSRENSQSVKSDYGILFKDGTREFPYPKEIPCGGRASMTRDTSNDRIIMTHSSTYVNGANQPTYELLYYENSDMTLYPKKIPTQNADGQDIQITGVSYNHVDKKVYCFDSDNSAIYTISDDYSSIVKYTDVIMSSACRSWIKPYYIATYANTFILSNSKVLYIGVLNGEENIGEVTTVKFVKNQTLDQRFNLDELYDIDFDPNGILVGGFRATLLYPGYFEKITGFKRNPNKGIFYQDTYYVDDYICANIFYKGSEISKELYYDNNENAIPSETFAKITLDTMANFYNKPDEYKHPLQLSAAPASKKISTLLLKNMRDNNIEEKYRIKLFFLNNESSITILLQELATASSIYLGNGDYTFQAQHDTDGEYYQMPHIYELIPETADVIEQYRYKGAALVYAYPAFDIVGSGKLRFTSNEANATKTIGLYVYLDDGTHSTRYQPIPRVESCFANNYVESSVVVTGPPKGSICIGTYNDWQNIANSFETMCFAGKTRLNGTATEVPEAHRITAKGADKITVRDNKITYTGKNGDKTEMITFFDSTSDTDLASGMQIGGGSGSVLIGSGDSAKYYRQQAGISGHDEGMYVLSDYGMAFVPNCQGLWDGTTTVSQVNNIWTSLNSEGTLSAYNFISRTSGLFGGNLVANGNFRTEGTLEAKGTATLRDTAVLGRLSGTTIVGDTVQSRGLVTADRAVQAGNNNVKDNINILKNGFQANDARQDRAGSSNSWLNFARIKITGQYANGPVTFHLAGRMLEGNVYLQMTNNSAYGDSEPAWVAFDGNLPNVCYKYTKVAGKSTTVDLYVQSNAELYQSFTVTNVIMSQYQRKCIDTIEYPNTWVSSAGTAYATNLNHIKTIVQEFVPTNTNSTWSANNWSKTFSKPNPYGMAEYYSKAIVIAKGNDKLASGSNYTGVPVTNIEIFDITSSTYSTSKRSMYLYKIDPGGGKIQTPAGGAYCKMNSDSLEIGGANEQMNTSGCTYKIIWMI